MDFVLVSLALVLGLFAVGMMLRYLLVERGSILDPIPISWAGFILYLPVAILGNEVFHHDRGRDDVSRSTVGLVLLATICYTFGVSVGRQRWVGRLLPRPNPVVPLPLVWFMWIVSLIITAICIAGLRIVSAGAYNPVVGVLNGSLGALALLSVMVVFGFRGRFVTRVLMLATLAGVAAYSLIFYFSRRPLMGLFLACGAFFYRLKLAHRSLATRTFVISGVIAIAMIVGLFLGATRGRRFYGEAVGRSQAVFSGQNMQDMLSGVTGCYELLEFTLQEFPSNHDYLLGSGMVPAFLFFIPRSIWESKPLASGGVITNLWYHTTRPENNIPNTIVGEIYMNFGIIGIFFGFILIGMVVRGINTFMLEENNNMVVWPAWLLIIPDFATEWRGDFTSITVQAFLRISVFIFIAWIGGRLLYPNVRRQRLPQGWPPGRPMQAYPGSRMIPTVTLPRR